MPSEPLLTTTQRAFVEAARRAVLATIAPDGRPRLVPICFSLDADRAILYTPLDEKPKRHDDPLALARVRDIEADPRVSVLVDRWDEAWARLAWLRAEGSARVLEPEVAPIEHAAAVSTLRARYPQYGSHRLEGRPIIGISLARITDWGRLNDMED
jgi:PPOX class probable F420-dependent enzyme